MGENIYIYNRYIKNRYKDLLKAKKIDKFDNNDLCKIFEYYVCIKSTQDLNNGIFWEYNDIDPNFKEENKMTRNDTGIDCSNLVDTIVQCKLRTESLTWRECATFIGSQNLFDNELQHMVVRWQKLIIARNSDSKLAPIMKEKEKYKAFTDITYCKNELIQYCESLRIDDQINQRNQINPEI